MQKFDCIVVGGGMVGAASALALAQLGLSVALVEKFKPKEFEQTQSLDLRVSAISLGSQYLLEDLNAWQQIIQWRACPYKRLAVWEDSAVYTEFNAEEISRPHLGHIVENRVIQLALWQQIKQQSNIQLFCPEEVIDIEQDDSQISVLLNELTIQAKLLVAADGANSQIRQKAGIGLTGWDYQQSAMLINVETVNEQQDITWQQFYPTGPLAMLPLPGNYASLVWYQHKDEIDRLSQLSNEQLAVEIKTHFPEKLGEIKSVLGKGAFRLTRRHANSYQQGRVLLLGDAAHTINPLAGQGVNLGFKDVKALHKVIATAIGNGEVWSDLMVLARYERSRRYDNLAMMSTMDAFYGVFSQDSSVIKTLRNTGLKLVNKLPRVKQKALAYACGL